MSRKRPKGPSRRRVLAGAAASWLADPSPVRASPDTLKIAVLLPRSGYLAPAGQSCHRGALMAPGVLADFGYRVQLLHGDFESSAEVARTQCERAIDEGARCIVGAFDSACLVKINNDSAVIRIIERVPLHSDPAAFGRPLGGG